MVNRSESKKARISAAGSRRRPVRGPRGSLARPIEKLLAFALAHERDPIGGEENAQPRRGYEPIMQRSDDPLRRELGQTVTLFGMAVALVLAVLLAGLGL
jgi:hypothetical protein